MDFLHRGRKGESKQLVSSEFTDLYASDTKLLQLWTHTIFFMHVRSPRTVIFEHATLMDFHSSCTLFLGNSKILNPWRWFSKSSLPRVTPRFQLKDQTHHTTLYCFLYVIISHFLPAKYIQCTDICTHTYKGFAFVPNTTEFINWENRLIINVSHLIESL